MSSMGMYWITLAMWAGMAALAVSRSPFPAESPVPSVTRYTRQTGPFGSSIFDDEELELSPIGDVEYEYDYDDYEDTLYDYEIYGDYEEPFIEPIQDDTDYEYDDSAGPFGNSIFDLDDILTSNISDIEYEYDYEDYDDYNEIEDNIEEPSKKESSSKTATPTEPKPTIINKPVKVYKKPTIITITTRVVPIKEYNFQPIPHPPPPKFQPIPHPPPPKFQPQSTQKPVHQQQPNYRYRFTPQELQYMYGKPRQPKNKPKPVQTVTNPIQGFVRKLRNKVGTIFRFVNERIRNPRTLFELS